MAVVDIQSKEPVFCRWCGGRLKTVVEEYDPYTGYAIRTRKRCDNSECKNIKYSNYYSGLTWCDEV